MSLRYRASLTAPNLERPIQCFGNDLEKIRQWSIETLAQRTATDTPVSVQIIERTETAIQSISNANELAERREAAARLKEKDSIK